MVSAAPTADGRFRAGRHRRRWPTRATALDVLVAVAAFGGTLLLLWHGLAGSSANPRKLDLLGVVLAGAATLPLLAWRRHPMGVFVLCTAVSASLMGAGYAAGPPLGATIALYLLAASRDEASPWTRGTTAIVGALLAIHVGAVGLASGTFPTTALAAAILLWTIAWFAGERTRLRRAQLAELQQRALQAERETERERRLAAAEERARIARDLHDSAGHAINVIGVQAGAARLLLERDPDRSRAALQAIEDVARQTVGEIDQIVRTLRAGDAPQGQVETPPGLASLGLLVAHHAATGLDVTVVSNGEPRPLPGAVDQAAYRILQEALTNAARHGSTANAQVRLAFSASALELTVTNPMLARDAVSANGGHGLIGMHERAALLGGNLDAEPQDDAFRVHTQLPYGDRPQ